MNPIDCIWLLLSLCFFFAFCIHVCAHSSDKYGGSWVYVLFQDFIRYGKTKTTLQRSDLLRYFDVPKRWFFHFYAVSVIWNSLLLTICLQKTLLGKQFPGWLESTLSFLNGGTATPGTGEQFSLLLVQVLLCAHSLRRLLECLFVSVFSNGVIHLAQYGFGLGYYILLGLTVLCTNIHTEHEGSFKGGVLAQVRWNHFAGVGLFVWASVHQHRCHVILANLRKGRSGEVLTLAHCVPHGDWFRLVSCPHYFAELLIYVSYCVALGGGAPTWWLVVLYVFCCQALEAVLCHQFYLAKFDSYPKHRKAFIPLVL
nr:PREDICTED: polyprenol reductase isoform X1 [Lepisosteus oculatus]